METEKIIENYLAYQDAPLKKNTKIKVLDETLKLNSARNYANILKPYIENGQIQFILELSQEMQKEVVDFLKILKIKPNPYTKSITWGVWHIAKQLYYVDNPSKTDQNKYEIVNPFQEPIKSKNEIMNGHIGWELFHFCNINSRSRESILKQMKIEFHKSIIELLNKTPKDNGTLSSYQLIELGRLLKIGFQVTKKKRFGLF